MNQHLKLKELLAQKRLIEASIETLKKELTFYQLPSFEKIALFKKRFFARNDVYAKERQNKKGYYPLKDNYESKTFTYLPLTDEAIKLCRHACTWLLTPEYPYTLAGEYPYSETGKLSKGKSIT